MKIGDYIRINNGQIAKIIKIKEYKKWSNIIYTDILIDFHEDRCCNENEVNEEDILKSSPNIIDLIEVGDYVNGYLVTDISLDAYKNKIIFVGQRKIEESGYYRSYYNSQIKSVVTKEQFSSMEYRMGE